MPELPVSVRVALWATHAWAQGSALTDALARAMPDVDHVTGDLGRLELWRNLGEQAVLVALPAPGDTGGLPHTDSQGLAAAADAGECVFAPGLGGLLVPEVASFGTGPQNGPDRGTSVAWTAYDADPLPRHRVEALDPSSLERHLRAELQAATQALAAMGGEPIMADTAREHAEAALGGRWGLPPSVPAKAGRALLMAATTSTIAQHGIASVGGTLDAATAGRRARTLTELRRTAERALADATNAACAVIAGWRPG